MALRYAAQYPEKVRYLQHGGHQNLGMSASRNLGMRHAQGEYIAILDADDVWLPHILEEQVAILESHPEAAMVYGPLYWWYSWTGHPEDVQRDFVQELHAQTDTVVYPPGLLPVFIRNPRATPSGILVRYGIIKNIGGFEEAFRGMFEDQIFRAKVCLQTPVFVSSRCWYRYRQHPDSCCAPDRRGKITAQYHAARLVFLHWLEGYLSAQGVEDSATWTAIRKELRLYRHPVWSLLSARMQPLVTQTKSFLKRIARRTLPAPVRRRLSAYWHGGAYCPPVGWVRLGHLRRLKPISQTWGFDRGLPIDRYYIERFLSTHRLDIRGHVLEIQDDTYTCKFGSERVTRSDVLHMVAGNPRATIVADLTCADHIPSDTFDCIILTQTVQFIYDVRAVLKTLYRILKPGGVLLATLPGISQISRRDMNRWGDYWRFTTLSSRRLLEEIFPADRVAVEAYGNVLAAVAFLHGLATQELPQQDLDSLDLDYEVLITVRAAKPEVAV